MHERRNGSQLLSSWIADITNRLSFTLFSPSSWTFVVFLSLETGVGLAEPTALPIADKNQTKDAQEVSVATFCIGSLVEVEVSLCPRWVTISGTMSIF